VPRIPDAELEQIKRGTDLAALVRAKGIELRPHGGGHLAGKCPFHDDKTPSFIVTPGKNLFHCLGCGAGGTVIDFVMKHDGLSFRHAVEVLRSGQASVLVSTTTPTKKATVPRLPPPVAYDADDQTLLAQVIDYYHERLKQTPAALDYLKKRGLGSGEALATFKLGFADRTLGLRLPQKNRLAGADIRERLTRLGLYRESGHEHFNGCVVFPIIAASGEITEVYGRKVIEQQTSGLRHLYLPGAHRGFWNPACLHSREVILCEALIDALTFWCAGYRHVTAAYGVEGFTGEMEDAIVSAKVERVLIAFDRDEAGDRGAAKVAEKLEARGVECARVQFPHGLDANEYALKVAPPDKSLGVLLRAARVNDPGPKMPAASSLRGVDAAASSDVSPAPAPSSSLVAAKSLAAEEARVAPTPGAPPAPTKEAAAKEKPMAPLPVANFSAIEVVKNEPEEIVLGVGDREYRVRGLAKNAGFESLRVSLRAAFADNSGGAPRWHLDTLDLCSARAREGFIHAAAAETGLKPDLLKRDLGRVLLKLEELQEARLKAQVEAAPSAPGVSAEEREAALGLLRDPRLLDRILRDFAACGVVGEETNKLVGYLAAVSHKLDNPLAVIVQSTSAAGKTALMEAVLAFVPPEERVKYSALTGQALYYLSDADLKHKILAVVEEEGAERASYALKLLQSEGELTIASTGKDPHTGRMVTQEYRVEGPVMIFLTTTAVDIDEELLNRCLVLTVDEGREQTAAIHRMQRERETLDGLLQGVARSEVLKVHRAAQRLLRPLPVVNPYAAHLTFLDDRTRTRRDHTKYLALIRTIALLHQYQRPVQTVQQGGKTLSYIEATLDDIASANALAHDVLGRCLDEMPPQTRGLLDLLERMVSAQCKARKLDRGDVLFSRRDVRATAGWSDTQLRVHLERLVELEYVLVHRGGRGQSFVYELLYDGSGKDGGRFLPGLLDVEKLRRAYEANPAGAQARFAGGSRGQNGANAGGSRPGQNGDSRSENGSSEPQVPANAHLGGAALAVAS
jgi:DNA primase